MTPTKQSGMRLPMETFAQIEKLTEQWRNAITGKRLPLGDVVAECVKRVYEQEIKKQERRK
jgi:hypothetical protein